MALENKTIGGQEFQHALIGLQLATTSDTLTIKKFKSLDYEDSAEKKPVHNSEGKIIGYTIDAQKPTGNLSMLLSEWNRVEDWASQAYPDIGIAQIEFMATVTYGARTDALRKDSFAFMIQKSPRKSSDNQEALVVEIPLFVWAVSLNDGAGDLVTYSD